MAYVFLGPWLIGLVCLTAGPMIASLYLSFTNYGFLNSPAWIGLDNYRQLLTSDPKLMHSAETTLIYVVTSVPLSLATALLVALALSRSTRGIGYFRSAYYVPSLLGGSVAIAILWRRIFGADGLVNLLLKTIGLSGPSWISDPRYALGTLVVLHIWQFGAPMVIFLAGLKQVPAELYDAATVDGASSLRRFISVTFPLLTPLIFFNLVLSVISAFQAFTPAYVVSGGSGGPVDSTLVYTLYLYLQAFSYLHMGYANAMAWLLLAAVAIITSLLFFTSRYWVHYLD